MIRAVPGLYDCRDGNVIVRYKMMKDLQHDNVHLDLEFAFDEDGHVFCRWIADVADFDMPVRIRAKGGSYYLVSPSRDFQPVGIDGLTRDNLEVDTFNFYIGVLVNEY